MVFLFFVFFTSLAFKGLCILNMCPKNAPNQYYKKNISSLYLVKFVFLLQMNSMQQIQMMTIIWLQNWNAVFLVSLILLSHNQESLVAVLCPDGSIFPATKKPNPQVLFILCALCHLLSTDVYLSCKIFFTHVLLDLIHQ